MAGDSLHYSAPATHIISYNGSRTNLTMQSGDQAIVDRTKALRSKSGNQTTCRLGIRNSFVVNVFNFTNFQFDFVQRLTLTTVSLAHFSNGRLLEYQSSLRA
ncbi:hypothetical protein AcV7_010117 [Taiwanofungus camphoratus]|nr:hypothetical protein AcV7_010117 [Antrodia cinnamomea]